ncbi:MAG: D-alanyl-D-alanine endopeptidase [Pseudomonadota bacterium]
MQKRIWATLAWCVLSSSLFAQPVASLSTPTTLSAPSRGIDVNALDISKLRLTSNNAMVVDTETGRVLYSKNPLAPAPIASITKLMTAMVVLDAQLSLDEPITITSEDMDVIKNTHSRLKLGVTLSRREIMRLALMSSENRAAAALGRNYPGGIQAFVRAMNKKAASLGMTNTHYADSTGLSSSNQSTAEDLVRMVHAAVNYQPIRDFTTTAEYWIEPAPGQRPLSYRNSNALMRDPNWDIVVSKTGYIQEAGRCLVMIVRVEEHPITIVMLDANGKQARLSDAHRIKSWLENGGQDYDNSSVADASETPRAAATVHHAVKKQVAARKKTYKRIATTSHKVKSKAMARANNRKTHG